MPQDVSRLLRAGKNTSGLAASSSKRMSPNSLNFWFSRFEIFGKTLPLLKKNIFYRIWGTIAVFQPLPYHAHTCSCIVDVDGSYPLACSDDFSPSHLQSRSSSSLGVRFRYSVELCKYVFQTGHQTSTAQNLSSQDVLKTLPSPLRMMNWVHQFWRQHLFVIEEVGS